MQKAIYNDNYRELIRKLRHARLEKQLTQAKVARSLGLGRNTVHKIEACEVKLDVCRFARLCQVLNVDPASLIGELARRSRYENRTA